MSVENGLTGSWSPDRAIVDAANLTRFIGWLAETGRGDYPEYQQLWNASVHDVAWFWDAIWSFYGIQSGRQPDVALDDTAMPRARWFPGVTMNYAAEVFRHEVDDRPALVVVGEDGSAD